MTGCVTSRPAARECPPPGSERWSEPAALHVFIGWYDRQDDHFPYRAVRGEMLRFSADGSFSTWPETTSLWRSARRQCGSLGSEQIASWVQRWSRLPPTNEPLPRGTTVVRIGSASARDWSDGSERRWVPAEEPAPDEAACLLSEMFTALEDELGRWPLSRVFRKQLQTEFARCPLPTS